MTWWLCVHVQLPQYDSAFRESEVDGPMLLELDDGDLAEVLGVEDAAHRYHHVVHAYAYAYVYFCALMLV